MNPPALREPFDTVPAPVVAAFARAAAMHACDMTEFFEAENLRPDGKGWSCRFPRHRAAQN